jgi:hypothetical protein
VVTKKTFTKAPWAKTLGPQNTYAIVTILAFIATLPAVFIADGAILPGLYNDLKVRAATCHPPLHLPLPLALHHSLT